MPVRKSSTSTSITDWHPALPERTLPASALVFRGDAYLEPRSTGEGLERIRAIRKCGSSRRYAIYALAFINKQYHCRASESVPNAPPNLLSFFLPLRVPVDIFAALADRTTLVCMMPCRCRLPHNWLWKKHDRQTYPCGWPPAGINLSIESDQPPAPPRRNHS